MCVADFHPLQNRACKLENTFWFSVRIGPNNKLFCPVKHTQARIYLSVLMPMCVDAIEWGSFSQKNNVV